MVAAAAAARRQAYNGVGRSRAAARPAAWRHCMGSQSAERLLLCDEIYLCDLRECARLKTKIGKRKVESVGSGCSLTNFPCYASNEVFHDGKFAQSGRTLASGYWEERTTSSQAHMVRWRPALSENVAMAITPLSQAQKCRERYSTRGVCTVLLRLYMDNGVCYLCAPRTWGHGQSESRVYAALTSRGFDEVRPRPLRGPRTSNFDEISTWGSIRTRPEPRLEPSSFRTSSANKALRNARTAPRFASIRGGSFGAGFAD